MLGWYSQHFDTVELNNTFYKLPALEAVRVWRESTPPNFLFSLKGSRFLTHMKKLTDTTLGIERFFERAWGLEDKLGPVVFQLPPHWTVNPERLEGFLEALPRPQRYAFEFRNETWNTREIFDLLRRFEAAYCIFDLAGFQSPLEITAGFTYIRLHGPGGAYQGSYDDRALLRWARQIRQWKLPETFLYFDNDQAGYAVRDAQRLRAQLE